jgi:hypothetical protein
MRKPILLVLGSLLTAASWAWAQEQLPAPKGAAESNATPTQPSTQTTSTTGQQNYFGTIGGVNPGPFISGVEEPGLFYWTGVEVLAWWLKDPHLAVPVVTVATPAAVAASGRLIAGAIGTPGTQVIPEKLDYNVFGGGRFTVGRWLDCDDIWGVEVTGFALAMHAARFDAAQNIGGPDLFVPFFSAVPPGFALPPGESAFILGGLNFADGAISVEDSTRLWGLEANGIYCMPSYLDCYNLAILAGCRYLDMEENLFMAFSSAPGVGPGFGFQDRFSTRNQFVGPELGVRGEMRFFPCYFASLSAKLALGDMHESVNVNGNSFLGGHELPGGLFAQPSNYGKNTQDACAVLPEIRAQAGWDPNPHIRVLVGFDFLYVSDVVRPGDQIDRRLNLTQTPELGRVLVGPALPAPMFNHTDFWAYGLSAAVTFRF